MLLSLRSCFLLLRCVVLFIVSPLLCRLLYWWWSYWVNRVCLNGWLRVKPQSQYHSFCLGQQEKVKASEEENAKNIQLNNQTTNRSIARIIDVSVRDNMATGVMRLNGRKTTKFVWDFSSRSRQNIIINDGQLLFFIHFSFVVSTIGWIGSIIIFHSIEHTVQIPLNRPTNRHTTQYKHRTTTTYLKGSK